MLRHIEDAASLSVVVLVGHALLEGTIALDVNNITLLVHLEEGGEVLNSVLLEFASEEVAGAAAVTFGIDHLVACKCHTDNVLAWPIHRHR